MDSITGGRWHVQANSQFFWLSSAIFRVPLPSNDNSFKSVGVNFASVLFK
jgi:hypothetical protein